LRIRNNDERSLLTGGREFSCSWRYYLIGVFDLTNAEQYLQENSARHKFSVAKIKELRSKNLPSALSP
jgi:hypothetical protein